MSNIILFADNAVSALASAITSSATSATLGAGTGSLFPSPTGDQFFCLTFTSTSSPNINEIVHVTNVTGDTLTIVRGQEGTTAQAWPASTVAANLVTMGAMEALTLIPYAAASGGPNAWTATIADFLGPTDGSPVFIYFPETNIDAGPTLDLNSAGAVTIYLSDRATEAPVGTLPAQAILTYASELPGWVLISTPLSAGHTPITGGTADRLIFDGGGTLEETGAGITVDSTGNQLILAGTSALIAALLPNAAETATVTGSGASGTIEFDFAAQSALFYNADATGNWTVDFQFSGSVTLDTAMPVGKLMTAVLLAAQGSTPYYCDGISIDGTSQTVLWINGYAPTSGNANGVDIYQFSIIKTADATYSVFASQTQYAS